MVQKVTLTLSDGRVGTFIGAPLVWPWDPELVTIAGVNFSTPTKLDDVRISSEFSDVL